LPLTKTAMHRLFVAIRPPERIRERLAGVMGGVSGARWTEEDRLHLTLRFIGEVDRHRAEDVAAALASIHHPRFSIRVDGLGAFDRRGEPVTLWAGLAPQEPLRALHKKIDQALARVGIEPDRRSYAPHITLARLPRGAGPLQAMLESSGGFTSEAFAVESFTLFESRLGPERPIHTAVADYSLA
jgi:RNA 2',3'-cyclic 3'-phosphodiesterase